MSAFAYLSVLISVIVGLGLSHLLTSTARLIQRRNEIRFYLAIPLWMATLFVLQVQIWWVTYDSRLDAGWNFFSFLLFLVIPVIAYLLCYLVIPDLDADEIDLRASYFENRVWFFGLAATASCVSFIRDLIEDGIPLDLNTGFRLLFIVLALIAILVKHEGYHVLNAFLGFLVFCAYVFTEFLLLR